MSRFSTFAIAFALECVSLDVWAVDHFEPGRDAFMQRDYALALELFLHAEPKEGDFELRYNIAVCHYHLKQLAQANLIFRLLYQEQSNQEKVAYSLAVTEKKLGNTDEARKLFLEIALMGTQKKYAGAAKQQYRELTGQHAGKEIADTASSMQFLADVRLGSDDNVIDPSDLSGNNKSDAFLETLVMTNWTSDNSSKGHWQIDGFVYTSDYHEVSEYDIAMVDVGFKKYFPETFGSWHLGARTDAISIGNHSYQKGLTLNAGAKGKLNQNRSWTFHYRYRHIDSLNEQYDPFAGNSQRLKLGLSGHLGESSSWDVHYRYEIDDLEDANFTDSFTSYSAQRQGVGAKLSHSIGDWRAALALDYRASNYLDNNLFVDGTERARQDDRYKLSLRTTRLIDKRWSLNAEFSYTDNDSNIERYDYRRRFFNTGISWHW